MNKRPDVKDLPSETTGAVRQEADSATPATRFKLPKWIVLLLLLGCIAGGGYEGARWMMRSQRQEARQQRQTAVVEQVNLPVTISANGTVQAERSINVSPKTSGMLKELLVKEGDRVRQGQILAYMDDSNLQGQLTQAKGQLESAQANLQLLLAGNRTQDIAQAQANLDDKQAVLRQAEQTLQQNQQLYQAGALSQRDLVNSQASRDSAQAQVRQTQQALSLQQEGSRPEEIAQARAQVVTAEGSLQTIQAQINDTIIRAPFSGIVTRKYADPGAFVTPTTAGSDVSSATSSSILSLASVNQVVAKVAETSIAQIKLGQSVTIQADAYPDRSFKGRVIQIATQSTVEQNVTNFEVKTSVDDPQNSLRQGMNTSVMFNVGMLNQVLVVPTVAIVRQQNTSGVMVVAQGEAPAFRPITTGVTVGNKTVVRSGLKAGDRILLSFPANARPTSGAPSLFRVPGAGPSRR
jgi:HlyD family secretion protein